MQEGLIHIVEMDIELINDDMFNWLLNEISRSNGEWDWEPGTTYSQSPGKVFFKYKHHAIKFKMRWL